MSSDDRLTVNPSDFAPNPPLPPVLDVVEDEFPPRPPPVRPPHPGFWWALLWGVAFLLVTLVVTIGAIIAALVFRAATSGNFKEYFESLGTTEPGQKVSHEMGVLMMVGMFCAEVATVLFAWLAIRLVVGREWRRRLAFRTPSMTHLIFALFSLPGLVIVASGVATLAREGMHKVGIPDLDDQSMIGELARLWPLWFGVLVVGVGPGIGEELLCRGFFGRGLVGRHGPVIGVLLTSFLFGLLHVDPALILGTGVIGMWLHYVYLQSRSLLLPMLLHFANNSLAVVFTALAIAEPAPDFQDPEKWVYGAAFYAGAVVLLGCIGWAMWQTRARLVTPEGGPGWQPPYPGVEEPPPGTGTIVERPWPGWAPVLVSLIGVAAFAAGNYWMQHAG